MTTEVWRPVARYEALYEVSNEGRVRSISRITSSGVRGGQLIAPHAQRSGHLRVKLSAYGAVRTTLVHRLVLEAFVGPCPAGMEARHYPDQDAANNRLTNLGWATRKVNSRDRKERGTDLFSVANPKARYGVVEYMRIAELKMTGMPQCQIAALTNISQSHISRVLRCYATPPSES